MSDTCSSRADKHVTMAMEYLRDALRELSHTGRFDIASEVAEAGEKLRRARRELKYDIEIEEGTE